MAMTTAEWVRMLLPVVVLFSGGLIAWAKLDAQAESDHIALMAEIERSKAVDALQDTRDQQTEIAVARIERDIQHFGQTQADTKRLLEEVLRELRKE